MHLLTQEQIDLVKHQITQYASSYVGKHLSEETYPLINVVRQGLLEQHPDVQVHLTYTAAKKQSSVDVTVNGTKISVVFTDDNL